MTLGILLLVLYRGQMKVNIRTRESRLIKHNPTGTGRDRVVPIVIIPSVSSVVLTHIIFDNVQGILARHQLKVKVARVLRELHTTNTVLTVHNRNLRMSTCIPLVTNSLLYYLRTVTPQE